MATLAARGLGVVLGTRRVLSGVDCAFGPGALAGVVGPNGSGKTTLLRALSGVLRPAAGQVLLDGQPVHRLPSLARARRLAVVAQGLPAEFTFRVREVVAMGRYPHLGRWRSPGPADRTAVARALDLTGATPLADRPFHTLSGGEQQRVAIARALAQEPEVLLLDEPSSHLDVHHVVELFDLLARLNRAQGLAVVAVLHDLNLAALYCRHLLLLHQGRVVAAGTPADVLQEAALAQTYGSRVLVTRHPLTGAPQVALVPGVGGGPLDVGRQAWAGAKGLPGR